MGVKLSQIYYYKSNNLMSVEKGEVHSFKVWRISTKDPTILYIMIIKHKGSHFYLVVYN